MVNTYVLQGFNLSTHPEKSSTTLVQFRISTMPVPFSIDELRLLQQFKKEFQDAKDNIGKTHVFKQMTSAAHGLEATKKMTKTEWEARKQVSGLHSWTTEVNEIHSNI